MRLAYYVIIFSMISSCGSLKNVQEETKRKSGIPYITFVEQTIVLGKVRKGESRTLEYSFTNTGDVDLLIELVTACKCTSTDWTRTAIPPGGKGKLSVSFDSKDQDLGELKKTIDIISNTDPIVEECYFTAEIVE